MLKSHWSGRALALLLVTVLLAAGLPGFTLPEPAQAYAPVDSPADDIASPQEGEDVFVYLPLVMSNYPQETIFGAALNQLTTAGGFDLMAQAESSWTRITLSWKLVEPTPGARNWDAVAALEQGLANAAANHMEVILVLEDTPAWAIKPGFACNIVAEDALDDASRFAADAAARYTRAPFYLRYFELWNEPDAYNTLGCWGDPSDEYFGGRYYGEMLQKAYPSIKAAAPAAQVLVGGLLMDCPSENAPASCSAQTGRFFEGILAQGAGSSFDGISFHAYDYYLNPGQYLNPNWSASWNTTGPSGVVKSAFLRREMDRFGVSGKYLINSETALLCGTEGIMTAGCATPEFEATKSAYLVQSYAVAYADRLRANIWYSVPGWRNSGLVDMNTLTPLPAYQAFKAARQFLGGYTLAGQSINPAGLTRIDFARNARRIAVMWSNTGPQPIPAGAVAVYDMYGAAVPLAGAAVGSQPVYVVFVP